MVPKPNKGIGIGAAMEFRYDKDVSDACCIDMLGDGKKHRMVVVEDILGMCLAALCEFSLFVWRSPVHLDEE